jgi:hypothetical protein
MLIRIALKGFVIKEKYMKLFRLLLLAAIAGTALIANAADNAIDMTETMNTVVGKDMAANTDAATRIANVIFVLSTRIHQGVCVILETKKELARVQAQPDSPYKADWINFLVNDISTAQTELAKLMADLLQLTQAAQAPQAAA